MMNDTIDILDGRVINVGINFEVYTDPDVNKYDVLNACVAALGNKYSDPLLLGEPLYITDIYTLLNSIRGVVDTKKVEIILKNGGDYADTNLKNLKSLIVQGTPFQSCQICSRPHRLQARKTSSSSRHPPPKVYLILAAS